MTKLDNSAQAKEPLHDSGWKPGALVGPSEPHPLADCITDSRATGEPQFCGYSVCGDRGGPAEACGKPLPCSDHRATYHRLDDAMIERMAGEIATAIYNSKVQSIGWYMGIVESALRAAAKEAK